MSGFVMRVKIVLMFIIRLRFFLVFMGLMCWILKVMDIIIGVSRVRYMLKLMVVRFGVYLCGVFDGVVFGVLKFVVLIVVVVVVDDSFVMIVFLIYCIFLGDVVLG